MRKRILLMEGWQFTGPDGKTSIVDLPHTWNAVDGQDGGDDYWRGTCYYQKQIKKPEFDEEREEVWIQFEGVNASAEVVLNGYKVCTHDGGYSTFRAEITKFLKEENSLRVAVDNSVNDRVYPQKADFTFYGGIYRKVSLFAVNKTHFSLGHFGDTGVRITAVPRKLSMSGKTPMAEEAEISVEVEIGDSGCRKCESAKIENASNDRITTHASMLEVRSRILDTDGNEVAQITVENGTEQYGGTKRTEHIANQTGAIQSRKGMTVMTNPHLWDGIVNPYLYTAVTTLYENGNAVDEVTTRFGIRSFLVDAKKGFFLNGRSYPLRGVCRHQDRKGIGNAITEKEHDEDMALIKEIGANTIRLAHYQHDQYFYDLCDEAGMVVWAEIPYISEHMNNGRENTISQMKELIFQNYNHPSIVCWGISNEITISTKDKKDMLDNHRVLNDLCHELDSTRFTTLACYAACGPFHPVAHITDAVSWNLYLGWYVPGLWLNDLWLWFFHSKYPDRAVGYSEYGAEAMPNLHSGQPRRNDHSEEYQAYYHEYMLRCFDKRPYMWATHCWNMFDFAADARNQGGEPGMNHKGLVTFDRKIKKDSFYLYKAWWSKEPFVHLTGKRYVDRVEPITHIKVYSNQPKVALYHNGKLVEEKTGDKVFHFLVKMPVEQEAKITAVAGECKDEMTIRNVVSANLAYKLKKLEKFKKSNWV